MSKIGAIILAAGMSKRMGQPKLLLRLKGKPLFRYPIELAIRNQLDPIYLIGGQHLETFKQKRMIYKMWNIFGIQIMKKVCPHH